MAIEQTLEEPITPVKKRHSKTKKKKSVKESIRKLLFLVPAYTSLILFVFYPIVFSFIVSIFKNPTVLELRNSIYYYTNFENLAGIGFSDFFYRVDRYNPGIFLIDGLVTLIIAILTIAYTRFSYKKLIRFKRLKDSKLLRIFVAFLLGLAIAPLTILVIAPLLIYLIDYILQWISYFAGFFVQVPWDEYREVLTDPDINFLRILFNTLFWTLTCTFIHIILGITLAILLNREFIGRGLFRAIFILPWAVPSFVSTLMWRALVFDKDLGILGSNTELLGPSYAFTIGNLISIVITIILVFATLSYSYKFLSKKVGSSLKPLLLLVLGLGGLGLAFLVNELFILLLRPLELVSFIGYKLIDIPQISSTFWYTDDVYIFGPKDIGMRLKMITFSAILINVWLGVPFMMLSFLATLQSIPKELYEAAMIDGLTEWAQFKKITLPLLKPTLLTVSLLGIIWTFKLFNVVYILTQNQTGLGNAIYYDIFVTFIYNRFSQNQYSEASALAFTVFLILISFSLVYRRFLKTEQLLEE